MITYIKAFILEFNPKFQELVNLVDNDLGKIVKTFQDPYGDELIGIANSTGLPLGDVVMYNIFYEIFTVCTSIVSQDSNGHMLHARNLDFGLFLGWETQNKSWIISELLRPMTINVNFTRGGKLQYITTGFAGFIGVFTGVKPVRKAIIIY